MPPRARRSRRVLRRGDSPCSRICICRTHRREVDQVVTAMIGLGVRFVVVTGDHTNGNEGDPDERVDGWWRVVRDALRPLRETGIPVLPVAGNHDTYTPAQRAGYAAAFHDLDAWTAPLAIDAHHGRGLAAPPFRRRPAARVLPR